MARVNPVVLEKGLQVQFFQGYDAATPIYPMLCTEVPSDAPSETYGWLGTAPTMREWVDERIPKGLIDHTYTITNNSYEASIEILSDDLDDDRTGQYNARVQDMGFRARRHPDSLWATLIEAGGTDLCYDGQAFFDSDHSEGTSGDQDNDLTYDATDHTAVTQAEMALAIDAAIVAMMGFVDDRGQPYLEEWNLTPDNFKIVVPLALRRVARQTVEAGLISNTDNVDRNVGQVITNARLTSSVVFYTMYVGAPIKPFIFQRRTAVSPSFLGRDSENWFMRKKLFFGVDARYNLGYGLWQYCVKTTFN